MIFWDEAEIFHSESVFLLQHQNLSPFKEQGKSINSSVWVFQGTTLKIAVYK